MNTMAASSELPLLTYNLQLTIIYFSPLRNLHSSIAGKKYKIVY